VCSLCSFWHILKPYDCWGLLLETTVHREIQTQISSGGFLLWSINQFPSLLLILVAELALFLFHFFHVIIVFCEWSTNSRVCKSHYHWKVWSTQAVAVGGGATHWMHSCRKYNPKLHLVHANSFGLLQMACYAAHRRRKSFIQVVNPGKFGFSDCHRWYCHVCAQQRCSRSIKSLHSCCASWGKVFQIVADGNWHGKESLYVVCSLLICCSHTRNTGEEIRRRSLGWRMHLLGFRGLGF
jgi:hypothetical protein